MKAMKVMKIVKDVAAMQSETKAVNATKNHKAMQEIKSNAKPAFDFKKYTYIATVICRVCPGYSASHGRGGRREDILRL
jgi:hypothetical protein